MINNNHSAWPQCGLKDAYLVYEIIAEGGITRMMALYKDKLPEKVGSVRSARHYFIDYAEENDKKEMREKEENILKKLNILK